MFNTRTEFFATLGLSLLAMPATKAIARKNERIEKINSARSDAKNILKKLPITSLFKIIKNKDI
jgi:hypothetical protein